MTTIPQSSVPGHVCIIMDGNGRWAQKRLLPRNMGHRKGVEATQRAIEYFANIGTHTLTLFAFSSENWNRPEDEVNGLLELFVQSLQQHIDELEEKEIRIRFIGAREFFSSDLQQRIGEAEQRTENNSKLTLNIALNYGGQWDIVNATQLLVEKALNGEFKADEIDQKTFAAHLSTAGCKDPDLFIRTGGERRISNFLIWQLAYTELFFCDCLWPDFSEQEMAEAVEEFSRRQRRYGRTGEQAEALS